MAGVGGPKDSSPNSQFFGMVLKRNYLENKLCWFVCLFRGFVASLKGIGGHKVPKAHHTLARMRSVEIAMGTDLSIGPLGQSNGGQVVFPHATTDCKYKRIAESTP